jgi:hypothetical protein
MNCKGTSSPYHRVFSLVLVGMLVSILFSNAIFNNLILFVSQNVGDGSKVQRPIGAGYTHDIPLGLELQPAVAQDDGGGGEEVEQEPEEPPEEEPPEEEPPEEEPPEEEPPEEEPEEPPEEEPPEEEPVPEEPLVEEPIPEEPVENSPPRAEGQTVEIESGQSVRIGLEGNDPDPDEELTISIKDRPADGRLTNIDRDGAAVTYTADKDFVGSDSFSFTVSDGEAESNEATVRIEVKAAPNTPPEAQDGQAETASGQPVEISLAANDEDPDEEFSFSIKKDPSEGKLTDLDGNKVTYTSDEDFVGSDSFSFTVSDGKDESSEAEVSIEVKAPPNNPPDAEDGRAQTQSGQPARITLGGSDEDGDKLTFHIESEPSHGTVSPVDVGGASRTYTPDPNYVGTDSFTFTASDGKTQSDTATMAVTVEESDTVEAVDDSETIPEDVRTTINVLDNDRPNKETLTIRSVTQGEHGDVSINGDRKALSYTPDTDFFGTDEFTYTIENGNADSDTGSVTIIVNPVSDSSLTVDLEVEHPTIVRGNIQTIFVTVNDAGEPIEGANVFATVDYAGPNVEDFEDEEPKVTDTEGKTEFSWRIGGNSDPGTFTVTVEVFSEEYDPATETLEFEVTEDDDGNGVNCDPSYPDVCIPPPPPQLNCDDISERNFRVLPPDPHGFDGNDNDGRGCEDDGNGNGGNGNNNNGGGGSSTGGGSSSGGTSDDDEEDDGGTSTGGGSSTSDDSDEEDSEGTSTGSSTGSSTGDNGTSSEGTTLGNGTSTSTLDNETSTAASNATLTSCDVSAPFLSAAKLDTFSTKGATLNGVALKEPSGLPAPIAINSSSTDNKPDPIIFTTPAPAASNTSSLLQVYGIPTYSVPDEGSCNTYIAPAFKIPMTGGGAFLLSPVLNEIHPGLTVKLIEDVRVQSGKATVKDVSMKYAISDSDVGFSFGVSGTIPLELKGLQQIPAKDLALFLDVGYTGNADYSNANAFESSPSLNVLVSKTVFQGAKSADGCPSISSMILDEATGQWKPLNNSIQRNTLTDSGDSCGYTLETQHFSKLAVVSTAFATQ